MTKIMEYKFEFNGWIVSGAVASEDEKDLASMLKTPINAVINSKHDCVINDQFGGANDPEGKAISMYLRPKNIL